MDVQKEMQPYVSKITDSNARPAHTNEEIVNCFESSQPTALPTNQDLHQQHLLGKLGFVFPQFLYSHRRGSHSPRKLGGGVDV